MASTLNEYQHCLSQLLCDEYSINGINAKISTTNSTSETASVTIEFDLILLDN
jgi:hypothetical protein